mmetsp:Transcript_53344/g.140221  ORF Transcript_53344/g.140221 Transcript_53344/m.140221 type:complete len:207 (-) Transcript_53344:764-1384(-)
MTERHSIDETRTESSSWCMSCSSSWSRPSSSKRSVTLSASCSRRSTWISSPASRRSTAAFQSAARRAYVVMRRTRALIIITTAGSLTSAGSEICAASAAAFSSAAASSPPKARTERAQMRPRTGFWMRRSRGSTPERISERASSMWPLAMVTSEPRSCRIAWSSTASARSGYMTSGSTVSRMPYSSWMTVPVSFIENMGPRRDGSA